MTSPRRARRSGSGAAGCGSGRRRPGRCSSRRSGWSPATVDSASASGQHDGRRLAAQLRVTAREVAGRHLHDALARADGAGEGDLVDARVPDQVLADLAVGGEDGEHALRQPGLPGRSRRGEARAVLTPGDGLRRQVQPASSAGASVAAATGRRTFQGTTAATTPTGSRRTSSLPRAPSRVSPPDVKSRATLIAESQTIIAPSAWGEDGPGYAGAALLQSMYPATLSRRPSGWRS